MTKTKTKNDHANIRMDRGDYAFLRSGEEFLLEIDAPLRVDATLNGEYAVEMRQRLRAALEGVTSSAVVSVTIDLPTTITLDIASARKLLGDLELATRASGVPLRSPTP